MPFEGSLTIPEATSEDAAERRKILAKNAFESLLTDDQTHAKKMAVQARPRSLADMPPDHRAEVETEFAKVAESIEIQGHIARQDAVRRADEFEPGSKVWIGVVTKEVNEGLNLDVSFYAQDRDGNIRAVGSGWSLTRSVKPGVPREQVLKENNQFRQGVLTRGIREMGPQLGFEVWGVK